MPRCQRTFRGLPGDPARVEEGALRWICPYCDEGETYQTVSAEDLLEYARLAGAQCARDFGAPADPDRASLLVLGQRPECVYEAAHRRYDLYLYRHSDPFQLRLQIGHEVFHRVCSQGGIFHWTHEMLACLVSVRMLRQFGAAEYAERVARDYREQAARFSTDALLASDLWRSEDGGSNTGPPTGLYGRAFVTGEALLETAGWPALCRLARTARRDGSPDVGRWMETLETGARRASAGILRGSMEGKP